MVIELKIKESSEKLHTGISEYGNLPFQTFSEILIKIIISLCIYRLKYFSRLLWVNLPTVHLFYARILHANCKFIEKLCKWFIAFTIAFWKSTGFLLLDFILWCLPAYSSSYLAGSLANKTEIWKWFTVFLHTNCYCYFSSVLVASESYGSLLLCSNFFYWLFLLASFGNTVCNTSLE